MKPLASLIVLLLGLTAHAQPATEPAEAPRNLADVTLPGIAFEQQNEQWTIVLEAQVVLREADWLELLACTPNSREHESILTVTALPSNIHLALTMLGLEPGHPLKSRMENGDWVADPPTGPKVAITVAWDDEAGATQTAPASQWVMDRGKDQPMADEPWLFAGSRFQEFQGKQYYLADHNGTAISLVNFGDDLLARPSLVTNDNDQQMWGANTEAIPPVGTPVKVRLTPVVEVKKPATP